MTRTTETPQGVDFRVQWWRLAIPAFLAVAVFGFLSSYLSVAMAILCVVPVLVVCAVNWRGLRVSNQGIDWYIIRPQWTYRSVPWSAVQDVRKTMGFLNPIRLIVTHGKYELWLWGTPKPDQQMDVEIWPNGFTGGENLWETIEHFRAVAQPSIPHS